MSYGEGNSGERKVFHRLAPGTGDGGMFRNAGSNMANSDHIVPRTRARRGGLIVASLELPLIGQGS